MCFYWLGVFGWWGVPLCCVVQFLGPYDMGSHMLIGGVAMCLYRFYDTMCNWGFCVWGAKRCVPCGYPRIECIWILMFGRYVHLSHFHFSKNGWRVFALFGHLITICLRMEICFWLMQFHGFHDLLLWLCGGCGWLPHVWRLGNLLASRGKGGLYVCGV